MPRLRFTEKNVAKLAAPDPSGEQVIYWDEALPGFGLLVSGASSAKTWVAKATINGRGVRRKIGRADVTPLVDARAAAKKMMANFAVGIDPRQKKLGDATLRMVLDGYVENARLKPRTKENYRGAVEHHLADWLDKPMGTITREMVEKAHKRIAEEVEQRDREKTAKDIKLHLRRAERTEQMWPEASERHRALHEAAKERQPRSGRALADNTMRVMRALWNFAADKDPSVGPNPVRLKRQWFKPARRETLVKADDLPAFHDAVMTLKNEIHRDYIRLLLFTGLRRREAARLTWEDVDLKAGIIRVPSSSTKNSRHLNLPMADVVKDMLVARRSIGKAKYVFLANLSASGHIEEPKFALNLVAKQCGVRISAHDLRRTFISVAESCDISPIALKALVNHALGGDVTSGYVVLSTERLREAAQRVADRLKELCNIQGPEGNNVERLRGRKAF
jgi:integrase